MNIVPTSKLDKLKIDSFFIKHWGSPEMVISSGTFQCNQLDGFAVLKESEEIIGLITYKVHAGICEIISLDSLVEKSGIGSSLIKKVEQIAQKRGTSQIKIITTNDNLHALSFYQKRGYQIVEVLVNAVDQARKSKPEIPFTSENGIPIRDEIVLQKCLRADQVLRDSAKYVIDELPKVILRELIMEDANDRYQWCKDPEVTRHLNMPDKTPPFSLNETKGWIEKCINKTNGYEQKAILAEDGKHIGWIDLKNIDSLNKHAELGITIGDKNYWGKGYGIAAMNEMLLFGFQELGLNKIWLRVEVDNEKAIKSYKRAGYVEEGILRQDRLRKGMYVDRLRMSILKDEYVKGRQS